MEVYRDSHNKLLAALERLHDSMHRIKNERLRYICDVHPDSCETRQAIIAAKKLDAEISEPAAV